MIVVTPEIAIGEDELDERFVRAQGPGGQNVNKVSSAVQLRFDVRQSPNLPDDVAVRLMRLAGSRMSNDGILVLTAQSFRTQERNRADARARLLELIAAAAVRPARRQPTRPTLGARARRLDGKSARAGIKAGRARVARDD